MDMPINATALVITPKILSLVAEIDEFKGAWRALGTLAPDRLSALRRVATIESIGSQPASKAANCQTPMLNDCSVISKSKHFQPAMSKRSPAMLK